MSALHPFLRQRWVHTPFFPICGLLSGLCVLMDALSPGVPNCLVLAIHFEFSLWKALFPAPPCPSCWPRAWGPPVWGPHCISCEDMQASFMRKKRMFMRRAAAQGWPEGCGGGCRPQGGRGACLPGESGISPGMSSLPKCLGLPTLEGVFGIKESILSKETPCKDAEVGKAWLHWR